MRVHLGRLRSQSGATLVEFAIVMPVLFLLVFGIIGFSIVFGQNLALSNGARDAARAGVVEDADCGIIRAELDGRADGIALDGADTQMQVDVRYFDPVMDRDVIEPNVCPPDDFEPCAGREPGATVVVTAYYESSVLGIIPLPGIGTTRLQATGEFRCEFT